MAEENILKSNMDSGGLNVENVQNVREIENDLIDELSKKIGENNEKFDDLEDEMGKTTSDILTAAKKLKYVVEDDVTGMLKEGKRKLDNSVNDVNCDFSGIISDSTTLSNEIQDRTSKNLEDIKDKISRFAENIGEIVPEKADKLEKLEKIEKRTESVLAAMNNEGELAENIGAMASEISTGFEELCQVTFTSGLGETVDKNVGGIVSEKANAIKEFNSDINEKAPEKLKEKEKKMDEFTKETFENFQKLNEADLNMKDVEKDSEKLEEIFKEGIDGKINEINMRMNSEEKDITCGSDDREKRIIEMSDICIMENEEDKKQDEFSVENEKDIKQDEFSRKNPVGATNNLLGAAVIDNLQSNTSDENIEEMKEVKEKRALKLEYDKEIKAIKKIVSAGANVPEQVGILSENGIYHDDYELEKPESIVTAKLRDFGVDEMEEAFNVDEKLKEAGIIGDGTHQENDNQKEATKIEAITDTIDEVLQKEMQREELHNMMIDLIDSNIAAGDSKSEIQFIGDEEQKLANISPQLSPISEQTKKLTLSSTDEPEPQVLQHPNIAGSSNIAPENAEKKESEYKHSSEAVLESSFVKRKPFIVDEEKIECEIKPIPVPPLEFHLEHFTDQNASQSAVSMKGDDRDKIIMEAKIKPIQEKIEPELQSAKTSFAEKSRNLGGPPNRMLPLSPKSTVLLRQPVLPSKNAPPPVPPKKKSIEMILAEEARAMRQHSLRGFEALVQGTIIPEIKNDELKSEKRKQNIEISTIQEQAETATDKNEKHEMMQNSDQKMNVTLLTQTEKSETQMEKIHPVPPITEVKSEVTSEMDKTDAVKLETIDGQQQQSRRCTML